MRRWTGRPEKLERQGEPAGQHGAARLHLLTCAAVEGRGEPVDEDVVVATALEEGVHLVQEVLVPHRQHDGKEDHRQQQCPRRPSHAGMVPHVALPRASSDGKRTVRVNAVQISPSILSADFANLEAELTRISTADWAHVDVMDGHRAEPDHRAPGGRGPREGQPDPAGLPP